MAESEFELDLDELTSAEEFLEYFEIPYQADVVHVNRLHILQRFHDYIESAGDIPEDEAVLRQLYKESLSQAYQDFVESDAQTEKVFKVFKMMQPSEIMVPLSDIFPGAGVNAAKV